MTATEYAKKNGFISAIEIGKWKGFLCYEAIIFEQESVNDVPIIGFPQIILEKNGNFRMANYEESMEYLQDSNRED